MHQVLRDASYIIDYFITIQSLFGTGVQQIYAAFGFGGLLLVGLLCIIFYKTEIIEILIIFPEYNAYASTRLWCMNTVNFYFAIW